VLAIEFEGFRDFDPGGSGFGGTMAGNAVGTLGDALVKQPLGEWGGEERQHTLGTGGFPEDGDVARITTECADVVPDPLERRDLVQQAEIDRTVG
jgi:hypothetical protein